MSLEQSILSLTASVDKNNALLERVLNASPLTGGAASDAKAETKQDTAKSAAADEKAEPKAAGAKKSTAKPAAEGDTDKKSALKAFANWLSEFDTEHPETVARQAALRQLLDKLGEEKISTITDAAKIGKLVNWLETKGKTKDAGFGIGRFAADPEGEDEGDAGDDDLDV